MSNKVCTKCKEEKPLADFHRHKRGKFGVRAQCKNCTNLANKARYQEYGKESWAEARRKWQSEHPEKFRAYQIKYRSKNKEKVAASHKEWAQRNAALRAASASRYHAAKLQRTPSWANEQLIAAYYKEAKRLEELTGIKFDVDHIIPLQGELVSGLHVETNLQLLPAHQNRSKHNSFDPDLFVA